MKDKDTKILEEAYESIGHNSNIVNRSFYNFLTNLPRKYVEIIKRVSEGEIALDDYDPMIYEKLFEYFLSMGEIPYGVAKARTGDPYDWITNQLTLLTSTIDAVVNQFRNGD